MTTLVRQLLAELRALDVPASWDNTGGGCMAIAVYWSGSPDSYRVLVTDRDDVFAGGDLHSDENVTGFYAHGYAEEAEDADGPPIYESPEPALEDLAYEVDPGEPRRCAQAIAAWLADNGR